MAKSSLILSLKYRMTKEDFREYNALYTQIKSGRRMRINKFMSFFQAFGGLLVFVILLMKPIPFLPVFLVVDGIITISGFYGIYYNFKKFDKAMEAASDRVYNDTPFLKNEITIDLFDNRIIERGSGIKNNMLWQDIDFVLETPTQFVIFMRVQKCMVIPKHSIEGQVETFQQVLENASAVYGIRRRYYDPQDKKPVDIPSQPVDLDYFNSIEIAATFKGKSEKELEEFRDLDPDEEFEILTEDDKDLEKELADAQHDPEFFKSEPLYTKRYTLSYEEAVDGLSALGKVRLSKKASIFRVFALAVFAFTVVCLILVGLYYIPLIFAIPVAFVYYQARIAPRKEVEKNALIISEHHVQYELRFYPTGVTLIEGDSLDNFEYRVLRVTETDKVFMASLHTEAGNRLFFISKEAMGADLEGIRTLFKDMLGGRYEDSRDEKKA